MTQQLNVSQSAELSHYYEITNSYKNEYLTI